MTKIKKCIFDMDGLLINTERQMWHVSELEGLEKYGYEKDLDFIVSLMGSSDAMFKQKLIDKYGPEFPLEEYFDYILKRNAEIIDHGQIDLMPGCLELLEYLNKNNIECVVGTSSYKEVATKLLTRLGIIKYFKEIFSGTEVEHGKPAPDIFLKCLGDTKKEEALVFEDSANGAYAAMAANIKLILVPDLLKPSQDILDGAYKIIKSLDEAINIIEEIN